MQINPRAFRINLLLCSILHGFNHYLLIFFKPLYPEMAGFFGLSNMADVTTRLTVAYLGYGISNFATGIFAKKLDLRAVLFFGMLLMSVSAVAVAFVPAAGYGGVIIFVFLMGLGGGTYHPAANTLMTSLYEKKPGHAIGMLSIGSAIGFIAAPLAGTHLGRDLIGFHNMFLVSGSAAFIFAWIFIIFMRPVPPLQKERDALLPGDSSFRNTPRVKGTPALAVIIILLSFPTILRDVVNWGYYEVTPYWVKHGFSHGIDVDWIQLCAYLPGLVIQPAAGKLCDRLGPFAVVTATFTVMAVGYSFLAFDSPALIWLGLMLYGIGLTATTVANETYMASIVSAEKRGLIYGIVLSLALGMGGYLGGASGWMIDFFGKGSRFGYQVWFAGMGLLTAASTLCYVVIEHMKKKHNTSLAEG